MHYAQVQTFGEPPQYLEGPDLPAPGPDQVRLRIEAVAVHRLVQMRAAGQHFTATQAPLDPSVDGVGVDEATGQAYYITTLAAPLLAEYANVDRGRAVALPAGADPVTVAALTNPVMSSWMALSERVTAAAGGGGGGGGDSLRPGFSVLVLGVTGTSGRAALPVARQLGAGRIVGAARNEAALRALAAADGGLDGYVVLGRDGAQLAADVAALGHVDVVLDYVYGAAAAAVLDALQPGDAETQYVNIGTIAQEETIPLRAQTLRSKKLTLAGSAMGAFSPAAAAQHIGGILQLAARLPKPAEVVPVPLRDIARVWDTDEARKKRLVLLPGA